MLDTYQHIHHFEVAYSTLLQRLVKQSEHHPVKMDRTGVGTWSIPFPSLTFDYDCGDTCRDGHYPLPLLRGKKVPYKPIIEELLWFLRGETNVRSLQEKGVTIWDEWADSEGGLGPVYGKQWRNFGDVDQIHEVHRQLYLDPNSRRIVVSAWNPSDLPAMRLAPCHILFQVLQEPQGVLNLQVYQRSADIFLGVPFNLASYATLLLMFCSVHQMKPGLLKFSYGDLHLYSNHLEPAKKYLKNVENANNNSSRGFICSVPYLKKLPENRFTVDRFKSKDFVVDGYYSSPSIPAPVAV